MLFKRLLQWLSRERFVLQQLGEIDGVVLTFDDGPHLLHTERILKILKDRGIRAIFFVLGSELVKYPELGKALVLDQQILGNHTFEHKRVGKFAFRCLHESVFKTQQLISSLSHESVCRFLRPPYGVLTPALIVYCILNRYRFFGWTWDSCDSFISNPEDLYRNVAELPLKNGDILLFHEDYQHTVEALPQILDHFIGQGVKFLVP